MAAQTYPPFFVVIVDGSGNPVPMGALALENGGHLASIDSKTPALGQALAAGSVPVVLTAAQFDALAQPLLDSNGTRLPENFGSLPYTVAYNSNSTVYTRIAGGNTYIQTSTIDSNGMEISNSGWVKQ